MSEGTADRLARTRPMALYGAMYFIGSVIACYVAYPCGTALLCAGIALSVLCVCLRLFRKKNTVALLCAAALLLGAGRYLLKAGSFPVFATQRNTEVTAVVVNEPEVTEERVVCSLGNMTAAGKKTDLSLRLYMRADDSGLQTLSYGDEVYFTGTLRMADGQTNPYQFDFRSQLQRKGLDGYATCASGDLLVTGSGAGPLKSAVYAARRAISDRIESLFGEENVPLVKALVTGDKSDLDDDLKQQFSSAGIAHVLAISGMHISVTALILMTVFTLFLPKKAAYIVTSVIVAFYAAVTGFAPSVIRALIMYMMTGAAFCCGERNDLLTSLGFTALVMLTIDPLYAGDAGFRLSFAACWGIALLWPVFSRLSGMERVRGMKRGFKRSALEKLVSALAVTLACEVMTLPVVAELYGTLPLLAVLGNLLLVPVALAGYALTLISLALGFLSPVPDLLFTLLRRSVELMSRVPFGQVRLPGIPVLLCGLYYAGLFLVTGLVRPGKAGRVAGAVACCAALAVSGIAGIRDESGCEVLCFDAGQANCALITCGGAHYLMDAGENFTPARSYIDRLALHIDGVFLTHPDSDHAAGLASILDVTVPDAIYVPVHWNDMEEIDEDVLLAMEKAERMNIPVFSLAAGDGVRLSDETELSVYAPFADAEYGSENEISLVSCLEYRGTRFVFTGDLPIKREDGDLPDCDVLMIAHHGSVSSTSSRSLRMMSPSVCILSVGENSFGHPSDKVLDRIADAGAELYRTDRDGAITVRLLEDGETRITTYR